MGCGDMSLYTYQNMAGQRFNLPERPTEPRGDAPLRYCTRCGGEIYYGTDTLCDVCLEETAAPTKNQGGSLW